jgi:4-fold beta-flower domain-containing protein
MATPQRAIVPIYTTLGEVRAFLVYPYIFNTSGEWIGWVTQNRDVYSVLGFYVGYLSNDPRILRKRSDDSVRPRLAPPKSPLRLKLPTTVPLAHMMSELSRETVDILDEEPERLHTSDAGELREDLDY